MAGTSVGLPTARNIGFQDDDIVAYPWKLNAQFVALAIQHYSACYTAYDWLDIETKKKRVFPSRIALWKKGNMKKMLVCFNPIDSSALMVNREVLDKVGLFEEHTP